MNRDSKRFEEINRLQKGHRLPDKKKRSGEGNCAYVFPFFTQDALSKEQEKVLADFIISVSSKAKN